MTIEHRVTSTLEEHGDVVAVHIVERVDTAYRATIRLRRPSDAGPIEPADSLNSSFTLESSRDHATPRRMCGVITELSDGSERARDVLVTVEPAFALLDQTRNSRIFQEQTVPEILEAVLGEALGIYDRSVELELTQTYEPREYCVQWQETDRAFCERLMAEEGISYAFDHSGDVELMVLRDDNASYPELAANDGSTVHFTEHAIDLHTEIVPEAIDRFAPKVALGRTEVTVRDHDWTGPQQPEAEEGEPDEQGRERASYEHGLGVTLSIGSYDEGVKRYQKQDADRQAPLRLEADRARLTEFVGHSTIACLHPGDVIVLAGHPHALDATYLVTKVEHGEGASIVDRETRGSVVSTTNEFVCIPIDVEHRPARTRRKPMITSAEHAIVVGPSGQEIHTDAHGRIKVQFPWDRDGAGDDTASCWMRVAQRWAGPSYGTMHIPRIGMEVVVRYLHGDPDRPIVTGALYNGDNAVPYGLPGEKTKSTIKSDSTIGGGGYNELRFEDEAGSEQIYLQAEKNLDEVVLANHTTTVGNDQTNTVHNDQTQTIKSNQTEDVHADQEMTVSGKRDVTVLSGFEEKVDGTETRIVTSGETEVIIGGQERKVGGSVVEIVAGGETRAVVGGLEETLDSAHSRVIAGAATRLATGTFEHTATGAVTLITPSMINNTAGGSFTLSGGPSLTIIAPSFLRFSNDHYIKFDSTTECFGLKSSIFGFVFTMYLASASATGAKASATGASAAITGISLSATGASVSFSALKVAGAKGPAQTQAGLVLCGAIEKKG